MAFHVQLTEDAARDLTEIVDYLEPHRSPARAGDVLEQIERRFLNLSEFPRSGAYPKELLDLAFRSTANFSTTPTASSIACLAATSTCS